MNVKTQTQLEIPNIKNEAMFTKNFHSNRFCAIHFAVYNAVVNVLIYSVNICEMIVNFMAA